MDRVQTTNKGFVSSYFLNFLAVWMLVLTVVGPESALAGNYQQSELGKFIDATFKGISEDKKYLYSSDSGFCNEVSIQWAQLLKGTRFAMNLTEVDSVGKLWVRRQDGSETRSEQTQSRLHYFLTLELDGKTWYLDATWKQFLAEAVPGESEIFVGTEADLRRLYAKYRYLIQVEGRIDNHPGKYRADQAVDFIYGLGEYKSARTIF